MPSAAAISILEFGRLLHYEASQEPSQRELRRVEVAEERLIERLSHDSNTLLKPALQFHVSKPIEPLTLRVLSLVAFLQLCLGNKVAIGQVAAAVGGFEPARVIEARLTISQLLIAKRLVLAPEEDDYLELGTPMLTLISGGGANPPLVLAPGDLYRRWLQSASDTAKRKAKESVVAAPTAKELAAKISEHVIGLEREVRTFACRLALHQSVSPCCGRAATQERPMRCSCSSARAGAARRGWPRRLGGSVACLSRPPIRAT
jgi:hypothetical protein